MSGELVAVCSAICYSLSYVFLHKGQSENETCDDGLLPVLVISSVTLCAAFALKVSLQPQTLDLAHGWQQAAGCAVLSGLLGTLCGRKALYGSIVRLGATRGVVIKSLAPVVTMISAILFLKEVPGIHEWLGFLLMGCSIALLVLERLVQDERSVFRTVAASGMALGLAAALLEGTGHVFRKLGTMGPLLPLTAATLDMTAAAIGYVLAVAISGNLGNYVRFYLRTRGMFVTAAGFLSAAGVLLFFVAISSTHVSTVAAIVGLQPVFVSVLSSLLFRGLEKRTWLTYIYTPLMVLGVVFVAMK